MEIHKTHARSVITIATGPVLYWNMAVNLARSIRRWHPAGTLPVTIVTDQPRSLPADLLDIDIMRIKPGELGAGFESKLHLDRLAPASQTLFIDSDCLVYGSLAPLFDRMAGRPVAVVGNAISDGEWFGDVAQFCRRLGVPEIPKFNGGLYYIEPGATATNVYSHARELAGRYDELGLIRLRNQPNDELLMAGALALHGLKAVPDDGTIMSDPQACPGPMQVNILRGRRQLQNPPPPSPLHRAWYPFRNVEPIIVHYVGHFTRSFEYRAEALRLKLASSGWPALLANLLATLTIAGPGRFKQILKDSFRPLFHRLSSPRPIKATVR